MHDQLPTITKGKRLMVIRLRGKKNIAGLHDLMQHVGKVDSLVEVGVFSGESTAVFSQYANRIYAIDPWVGGYDKTKTANANMEEAWRCMIARQYACDVLPIRAFSPQIAKCFHFVDMVYIDGCHSYAAIKADILGWKDKCRILAGHDYGIDEVKRAVTEVFKRPLKIFRDQSWLVKI